MVTRENEMKFMNLDFSEALNKVSYDVNVNRYKT